MTSAFHSWSDFWQMGGYAFYVWLAVAVTALSLLVVVWHACWQRRALLADVQCQMARERRMQAARKKGEAL
ncbi:MULTISPECIES: heme exporter protein CcmD [Citrobacter]|uniref:heme exporter protein CcmD n=1 Tax=Citrobacter TaxID=544 RepID=UPI0010C9C726|nr:MULTISPECIES: heme exporter protein CcmD [Citrobacter]MCU6184534.1 heme exporter protein CcmD [Citrobacter cronae]TKU26549.1 heme exporter protein CcmD [Citrobacter sp. wls717]TKU87098.1 heme exporter protein CcmD [Citrobacter sp. wls707]